MTLIFEFMKEKLVETALPPSSAAKATRRAASLWESGENDLQLFQRFNPGHALVTICARDVHQYCMHACAGGAEVVHGVDVADIEARFGSGVHAFQGVAKDFRVRLLVSDQSGVGDGLEAIGDPTPLQHLFN